MIVALQHPLNLLQGEFSSIEEEVSHVLEDGISEESTSPWSHPIVVVLKPNGTLRLCNDFRKLNQVSDFGIPHVDDQLERLGRSHFMSMLDLTKGYW